MIIDSSISAVVTGGASGLGLGTVKALRALGAKVALFAFTPDTGEAQAAETGATFCQVDVTSDEQVDAAFAKARAANGQERILVNCAGGSRLRGRIISTRRPASGRTTASPTLSKPCSSIRWAPCAAS